MARPIERLLNLQRGDIRRSALLFLYLFLAISSYVIGKSARDTLFLQVFQAKKLPYADITIAITVGFVAAAYVLIARRTSLRNLLIGSLVLFTVVTSGFWYLAHFRPDLKWQFPVFYIWVGIFGVLAPMQVWTLANYVLTTRQAKRSFGLIGSGAITGWIFAGFLTSFMAKKKGFGTESLLLVMAVFLFICVFLVFFIWRQREASEFGAAEGEARESRVKEATASLQESLRLVFSSPYLLAISSLICVSSLVTTFAGWQFKAIASNAYTINEVLQKDELTAFFGTFNFWAGIACLATQLLLTSRVLRRFGLGPALFVVPLAMLSGEIAILMMGTLLAAVLLKGGDQVLRYSIDKSSVELLYLPIPPNVKFQVKSFIDTVIWRMGDGLAGVTLAFFTDRLGWSAIRVSWVNIVFVGGWITAALVARRQYVGTLRECIQKHRLDSERTSAPVLDRSSIGVLAANLNAAISASSLSPADPKELLYALSLFEISSQQAAHPAVRELLSHPDDAVRQKALSILSGDSSVLPQVEKLLQDPSLEVRTEALLYLCRHSHIDPLACIQQLGDFADFSIRSALVLFLARPGDTQNLDAARIMLNAMVDEKSAEGRRTRLEAARLITGLPDEFEFELKRLLDDEDHEVARQAIRAVGHLKKRRLVPRVLDRLGDRRLSADVAETLAKFSDRIVGALRDHLSDASVSVQIRREIPGVLAQIGTRAAANAMMENLLVSDAMLRYRILSALNKLRQGHPELVMDAQMVEAALGAEIMGHYRSYQILGTFGGNLEKDDPVARALREAMGQEVERIFRLLSLLYPKFDFHSAHVGLSSENPVVHANALEFLDNVLKPQLRAVLVPLLDGDISVEDRMKLADRMVGSRVESREDAVAAMVASDDPWLKSCGAYAIGTLGLKNLEGFLDECLKHSDPLLRETARWAKLRLAELASTAGA